MKRILSALFVLCVISSASIAFGASLEAITSMDEVIYRTYTSKGRDPDFPRTGDEQMKWFLKRGELFRVDNDLDTERITRFGIGDVIYLTDPQGNYIHCFLVNTYDKATNRFTLLGALNPGDILGLYTVRKDIVKKYTLSSLLKLDARWKRTIIGSKNSKWLAVAPSLEAPALSKYNKGEEVALYEWNMKFVLPTDDWYFKQTGKDSKLVYYSYYRDPINDTQGMAITPVINVVFERVPSGVSLDAYVKRKMAEPRLNDAKELSRSIYSIENSMAYEGFIVDNFMRPHRIYWLTTLKNGIGTQVLIDSTGDVAPLIRDEAFRFLSSLSYIK